MATSSSTDVDFLEGQPQELVDSDFLVLMHQELVAKEDAIIQYMDKQTSLSAEGQMWREEDACSAERRLMEMISCLQPNDHNFAFLLLEPEPWQGESRLLLACAARKLVRETGRRSSPNGLVR